MKDNRTAIIVTHSTEVFGPPFALADYLKEAGWRLWLIDHPLDFDTERRSRLSCWQGNQLLFEKEFPNWLSSRAVNYLKDFLVTNWALIRYVGRQPIDLYVGCDSLSVLSALWCRPFIALKKIIAYNTDYSTARFDSALLNSIYLWADRYAMARAHVIWCVTERIAAVRRKEHANRPGSDKNVLVVPNGVYLDKIKSEGPHNKGLVFIGNLTKEKGIEELLTALTKVPKVKLTVFGDGGERKSFERLADTLKLTERVSFAGRVASETILEKLSDFTAGVALYQASQSYVAFSDPLKVKEYLGAALPVIVSDVPEIAQAVAQAKAGVVITDAKQLGEAIEQITVNQKPMQINAKQLAKQFDWHTIYQVALAKTDKGL